MMNIKKDLDISTDDFWYDLSSGGYLNPDEICENENDAKKIKEAVEILEDFYDSCCDQIEGFEQ